MSESAHDVPDNDRLHLRGHAVELRALAREHGVSRLRSTTTGRLLVSVDQHADYFDIADFAEQASRLLGRVVACSPKVCSPTSS